MAIGVALLLGFKTPANFNRPYCSFSVTEFWKRWHITFSSWLREYLYISMGGSRFGLDVPPYLIADGVNAVTTLNAVGLRRAKT